MRNRAVVGPDQGAPLALENNGRISTTVATYDRMGPDYARRVAQADLGPHRLRFQRALLRTNLPILDAGCGAGRDCSLFELDGLSPVGIDLSVGLLRVAQRATRAPLVLGDIRNLPFGNASFGGAWCCAVLLHLDSLSAIRSLTEMRRVVVNAGPLFVSVRLGSGNEWSIEPSGARRWFNFYQADEVGRMVKDAGFSVSRLSVGPGVVSPGTWINLHAVRC